MRIRLQYHRLLAIFVLVSMLPLSTAACMPLTYSSPEIEARVVDGATGQPLEGVIVVAHWRLRGGFFHARAVGELVVHETVTNTQGFFILPAWGPKLRSPLSTLSSYEPHVKVFKAGYEVLYLPHSDDLSQELAPSTLPLPRWHHTTLRLKKFDGSFEEYGKQLHFLEGNLGFALRSDDCLWKQIPRMLVAFDQERTRRVKAMGIPKGSEAIEHWAIEGWEKSFSPSQSRRCGSMKEYLRSYMP